MDQIESSNTEIQPELASTSINEDDQNPDPRPLEPVPYFPSPGPFSRILMSRIKEIFFFDDPFREITAETSWERRFRALVKYIFPILHWAPKYTLQVFKFDLIAGVTIAIMSVPQGVSFAKLAKLPPIVGLYSSFVPPLVYAIFGCSKHLAVGTLSAPSLLAASIVTEKVDAPVDGKLYQHLIYTVTLFIGIFQLALGIFRLGLILELIPVSTVLGFMAGTATQQLKTFLRLKEFTKRTDIISVLHSVFSQVDHWHWGSAFMGVIILMFLLFTQYVRKKNPKLFWVSALAPMFVVVASAVFTYIIEGEKHGIRTVDPLEKGINPISIHYFNFDPHYLSTTVRAAVITGAILLTQGIAVGEVYANKHDYEIDANKEIVAYGMMNLIGSCTSCYFTTGPFSKTALNADAGCKTPMSNMVMSVCVMFILLFLVPFFRYIPEVALATLIMSTTLELIKYDQIHRLFKQDKFGFLIFIGAFFGVIFINMEMGLIISVGISIARACLDMVRPRIVKLGQNPNSTLCYDFEYHPETREFQNILVLQFNFPISSNNARYLRRRVQRYINEEIERTNAMTGNKLQYLIIDLNVKSIDNEGLQMLEDVQKMTKDKGIKMVISGPTTELIEIFARSDLLNEIGKEWIFMCPEDAVAQCRLMNDASSDTHTNHD